jgi:hypothetical protein
MSREEYLALLYKQLGRWRLVQFEAARHPSLYPDKYQIMVFRKIQILEEEIDRQLRMRVFE